MEVAVVTIAVLVLGAGVLLAILLMRAREGEAAAAARLGEAEAQKAALGTRLEAAEAARREAELKLAASVERIAQAERRLEDFERLRQESLTEARAAVLETAQALSSKLLDDHKRESAEAGKAAEERVRQASEHLVRQVDDIAKAVAGLNSQVQEKGRILDTVWRSLSSPGGAGQLAEIGLANTLRGFGLEEGRDYRLQVTTQDEATGRRLRPDALVFLPGSSIIVIDCKASKFLVEIAAAEETEGVEAAYANLARTMNQHLKDLADKNYRGAVQAAWRESGRGGEAARIVSVMYLPNEGALEKLCRADPGFMEKARAAHIVPAGPAGLHCALTLAAVEINAQRQVENQQRILEGAQALIDGIGMALGHAQSVGKGLKSAADAWAKFAGSVNGRLLPRARRLASLGVRPAKGVPGNLPSYDVIGREGEGVIEGEASEVADETPPAPPRLVAD